MTRSELDRLRDDLYILQCALEDAEHDLELDLAAADLRAVIQWILEAAEPLRSRNDLAGEPGTA